MTYPEFLKRLKALKFKWFITKEEEIRRVKDSDTCPWLAVSVEAYQPAQPIWRAADKTPGYSRKIRSDLLKACRLK